MIQEFDDNLLQEMPMLRDCEEGSKEFKPKFRYPILKKKSTPISLSLYVYL